MLTRAARWRPAIYEAGRRWRWLNNALAIIASLFIVAITVLTLFEVGMRWGLNRPTVWTFPIISYLLLYMIYTATAHTLHHGAHIRVEFVLNLLPPRLRYWVDFLSMVLGLLTVTIILWQSFRITVRAFALDSRDLSMLSVPMAATTIIMPIGLTILAITYLVLILEKLAGGRQEHLPEEARTGERRFTDAEVS